MSLGALLFVGNAVKNRPSSSESALACFSATDAVLLCDRLCPSYCLTCGKIETLWVGRCASRPQDDWSGQQAPENGLSGTFHPAGC